MKRYCMFLSLAVSTTFILLSCTKDNGEDNNNGGTSNPGPLFTSVRSIVQTNCAVSGCHTGASPQNGINFSDDNTIVAQKDRIKVRAVDQAGTASQMPPPPRPALSAANQQAITSWISAGGRIID